MYFIYFILSEINLGKSQNRFPEIEPRVRTNFTNVANFCKKICSTTCIRTWETASRLVDRGLTATVTAIATAKNQPSVSTRFYVVNSFRVHAVGVVQIHGRQTDITKCRNVSIMQLKGFIFMGF